MSNQFVNGANPKDPLLGVRTPTDQEIFGIISQACAGLNTDQVMSVAVNLIINAIRQTHARRSDAEACISELFGKGAQILLNGHYDSVTGKRLSVYPFTQTISATPIKSESKIN
jgi:hypothetical protein